ncbi:cell division protein FtsQ/DivIB [uncultured Megamonas sp.]|uniref:cell division protein FtsQ/DivIB n=1 Tax=uncultured Megamonas sp. TaxID=286140 RepID=UPI00266EB410|nr:FtsQ-type POTRA domain-containing protein [uncultured Megamonas sp.]
MVKKQVKSKSLIAKKNLKRGLIGLFAILAIIFIINSPIFKIGYVKVIGNTYLPREDVLKIARIREPLNIFSVQTDVIQNYLQSDLRIDTAKVWRDFPNCLNIEIVERTPLAVVSCNYGYVDLDKNSMIIDTYKDPKKIQKPVIIGVFLEDVYTGDKVENEAINKVLDYLGYLKPELLQQIMQINIANVDNIEAYTMNGTKIILGKVENPEELANKTNEFFNDMKVTNIPIEYIDFSYSRPVLKIKQ